MLPGGWAEFLSRHSIVGGVVSSAIWFAAGKQTASGPRPENAPFWYGGGILVMVASCGWALREGEWIGFVFAGLVFCLEIWWIRRKPAREERHTPKPN